MSPRSASVVLTVLSSSLVTTTVVNAVVRGEAGEPLAQGGLAAVFIAVGAVLTWRVPGNRLSWLMAATGLAASTLAFEAAAATVAILAPVCAASLIVRFRRADHLQRAQLRWLAWSGGLGATAYLLGDVLTRLPFITYPLLTYGGLTLVGVSIAVAVTRYRLYDIDRLVSRTVGYAVVTSLLVAFYAGLILGAQAVLGPADAPDVVIAGSTLAAVALFRPLQIRVQRAVDRRFDRRANDGPLIVARFAGRLRDEVDLDEISGALRTTVGSVLRPVSTNLWLLPSDRYREGAGGDALR